MTVQRAIWNALQLLEDKGYKAGDIHDDLARAHAIVKESKVGGIIFPQTDHDAFAVDTRKSLQ